MRVQHLKDVLKLVTGIARGLRCSWHESGWSNLYLLLSKALRFCVWKGFNDGMRD